MSIVDSLQSQTNEECLKVIGAAFAILQLPLSLVEDETFIRMMYAFKQSKISLPSTPTLKITQSEIAEDYRNQIITKLTQNDTRIGWLDEHPGKSVEYYNLP